MKYRIINFIMVLTTLSEIAFTQTCIKLGPELGISSGGWNNAVMWNNSHKCAPHISPLIGITGQINKNSHLQFSSAIQYQMIISHWDTIFGQDEIKVEEIISFHKLCVPLKIGLSFKLKKFHPSVYTGLGINYLISGKLKSVNQQLLGPPYSHTENPFDSNEFTTLPKRFNPQFIFGLSNTIGQNFKINLVMNIGGYIKFSRTETRYRIIERTPYTTITDNSLRNNDFGISLTYFIRTKRKETKTEN